MMEEGTKSTLLTIPHELLFNVLTGVGPEDLDSLRATCRGLRDFVDGSGGGVAGVYGELLRGGGFLDEPPVELKKSDFDWQKQHRDLVALRALYGEYPREINLSHEEKILISAKKAISLIENASSEPDSININFLIRNFDKGTARGRKNIEDYLFQSLTYTRSMKDRARDHTKSLPARQASAKLHCYSGVPIRQIDPTRYHDVYPYAMSVVYDMRNYTDHSLWGPFKPDGEASVDWEKVEAIMIVLAKNLQSFETAAERALRPLSIQPWLGCQRDSFRSLELLDELRPSGLRHEEDPYNISGSWMRVVTFLDYHELSYYNWEIDLEIPDDQPRPPISTVEAIRLIMMELEVTSVKPDPDPNQKMPVVTFKGISRSLHTPHDPNANSNIRGCVRMTKEGEVRWTTCSVYNGEERWKSEGIQVGGVRSARGVIGHWFDKDMDNQQGPAGPSMHWKISNEIDEAKVDEWIESWGSDSDSDFQGPNGDDDEGDEGGDGGDGVEVENPMGLDEGVLQIPGGMGMLFFTTHLQ